MVQAQLDSLDQLRQLLQGKRKPASADAAKQLLDYRQAQTRAALLDQARHFNYPEEAHGLRGWLLLVGRYQGADRACALRGLGECRAIGKNLEQCAAQQQQVALDELKKLRQSDPQTAALLGG